MSNLDQWTRTLLVAFEAEYLRYVRSVEQFHLLRYLDEQAFRYTDGDRFMALTSHLLGKRLTYLELTGKNKYDVS